MVFHDKRVKLWETILNLIWFLLKNIENLRVIRHLCQNLNLTRIKKVLTSEF